MESIAIPTIPAVIIYFYRGRKDEPLHALAVELWIGQQKKAVREPVHTLGWKEANVREYIKSAIAQARTQGFARHGELGDGCWVAELCHKRRTYYKKRDLYNRNRRLKYRGEKEAAVQLESITIPSVPAVIIYFYRGRKDEPLHAMSVELWIRQQKKAAREPVHTLGWKEAQVREYIKSAIASFAQQYEITISGVAATVELKPNLCPLDPCPLKVEDEN